jgi:nucleoside-diphosphate-sugar epimerase
VIKVKILVTGGFGNIGLLVVEECLKRGYTTTVFDVPSKRNARFFKKYSAKGLRVVTGDIRKYEEIEKAGLDQDAVIHMAVILPPLLMFTQARKSKLSPC